MTVETSAKTRTPAQLFVTEKRTTLIGLIVKIIFLGSVASMAVWLIPLLIRYQMWMWLAIVILTVVACFAIYLTKRMIPGKYVFPGTFFLVLLLIVPVIMTVNYSFTNFGDGMRGTKQAAIDSIIGMSVKMTPDSAVYNLAIGTDGDLVTGPFTLFMVDQANPTGPVIFGSETEPVAEFTGNVTVVDGRVTAVEGYTLLTLRDVNAAWTTIQAMQAKVSDEVFIRVQSPTMAFQGRASRVWDEATNTITDRDTGEVFTPTLIGNSEFFVSDTGEQLPQGWLQHVGWANYYRLFTDGRIAGQFFGAFAWTLMFALGSVLLTFMVGFFLAITLNDKRLKLRRTMRSFLLLPYAVPAFISILIWSSFYNRDFGLINQTLGVTINWLGDTNLARMAVLITNTWLGFPYMFIVCTGALQSIPEDVIEAGEIDGASGFKRATKITLPLLLISVAPLLVASFAFNFNNFNMIRLLTEGGPPLPGQTIRGGTDILISMIYRIAFGGTGADYGFASAVSVALFVLTGAIAAFQFRMTRKLENIV